MNYKKLLSFLLVFTILLLPLFCESNKGTTSREGTTSGKGSITRESSASKKSSITRESTTSSKGTVTVNNGGIGVYDKVVNKTETNVYNSVTSNIYNSVTVDVYANGYGKYLETVAEKGIDAEKNFAQYFSDWQWSGQKEDFYTYASSRAEQEKQIELCYKAAVKKFGAGTAIIATTWVVAFVLPGGTIYQAAVIIIAKATTVGALSGGAIGAVTSAGIAVIQGKTGEELLYETVKGAADGYLVGAITGLLEGSGKVYKFAKEAKSLKDFSGPKTIFDNKVYDSTGKQIGKYYPGDVTSVNGEKFHLAQGVKTAGDKSKAGITYKFYLADDGNGNYFKVLMPDFDDVKIVKKTYNVPNYIERDGKVINLWKNDAELKYWCKTKYIQDLKDPAFLKAEGISKKEALLRIKFEEEGIKFFDYDSEPFKNFIKKNNISLDDVYGFLDVYERGEWHHLAASGEMIYVPKGHGSTLAPHTGGNKFWCEQAEIQIANGTKITTLNTSQ